MKILNFKFQILKLQAGFSVLEVILAAAIFVTFATAAVVVVISGIDNNRLGGEMTVANQFNAEGMEAVRSIKNQDFVNLTSSSCLSGTGVSNSTGVWAFAGTSDILSSDSRFSRVIKICDAQRDVNGNIVASGGVNDPNTKKVTATTTWNFTSSRPESVDFTEYFINWKASIVNNGPIMMAYSKTTSTPFYRIWNGSAWSAEEPARDVGGNINYVVLKSSRTRNEAILGTLDSSGRIYVQVWNGTYWGPAMLIATGLAAYRGFDIEYEKNSDHAVVVYLPTAISVDPAYRVWDGNSWDTAGTTITAPRTTGIVRWIDLAQNPLSTSNDIAMIMLDDRVDVYGMVWNGTNWDDMNAGGIEPVWDASAATAARKAIAVAYEQISGRAMFIWGDSVATDQYYRIWDGSTLSAPTLLDIPLSGTIANWVRLVSRPNSDELMYGVQGNTPDLNTRKWTGSGWDSAHVEHDTGTENANSMNFDIVWETHSANPGKAWIMWGDGATVSKRQWSGTAWGTISTLTGSDDTSFIRLKADPVSGAIFAGIYEAPTSTTDDIWESRLIGGGTTWSAKNTIWGGPTSGTSVYFRIDIATP